MSENEMLAALQDELDEPDAPILESVLRRAIHAVLRRLYPFDESKTELPRGYEETVIKIAVYLYNRRGSEGELSHDEGNIRRTYESADVPLSMLRGVVPYCGGIG